MKLNELRNLKDKQTISLLRNHPHFTKGKKYIVNYTDVGRLVINDNGIGVFLYCDDLYKKFMIVTEKNNICK